MVADAAAIARDVLAALDAGRQLAPFARRIDGFDLAAAYRVTMELRRLRVARGERTVGRKIGFTNRGIWDEYGVFDPIWGDMWDTTVHDVAPGGAIAVSHLPEPRIEPEIVLCLDRDLDAGMSVAEVAGSVAWVAHGFEIVQSIFPDWKFAAADCIANGGLHGALHVGPRRLLAADERAELPEMLARLKLTLSRNGEPVDAGTGANVLDGPVEALAHLVGVLAADPVNPPLRAGEIVTTGTVTRAFPVAPGERWSTTISGFDLPGLSVEIR
ncbi:MAG: 2-keto-4-pentenoate hydratase [Mesorhizobium sp.]